MGSHQTEGKEFFMIGEIVIKGRRYRGWNWFEKRESADWLWIYVVWRKAVCRFFLKVGFWAELHLPEYKVGLV